MSLTTPTNTVILNHLLERSRVTTQKDGSQGLEVLASLHQYVKAYDLVRQHVAKNATVLDWGGGSGHFSYFLSEAGYRTKIYAFTDPEFIESEIQAGKIAYIKAESHEPVRLPFDDSSFDAVFSIGVLEHVREIGGNERESLQEIRRILRPGGVFLCYHLPNRGSWIEFLAQRFGSYHHTYKYDRTMIEKIFDGALQIYTCKRYALLPRNSMRRLPQYIANNQYFSIAFDFVDSMLCRLLPWFNQNWFIVARKRDIPPSSAQT